MTQKTIVMTGATSGFGVAWFKALIKQQDAKFYVLARSEHKFEQLVANLRPTKRSQVHFVLCELDSLESIHQAATKIKSQIDKLDILINNAGVFPNEEKALSKDNIEMTFAVNHLAPFFLTRLLVDKLTLSPSARVVNTASFQHFPATINLDDLEQKYVKFDPMKAYQESKLCNVVFTRHLSQLLKETNITVNCFDPGIVDTPMTQEAVGRRLKPFYPILRLFFSSPEKGAETGVYLSLNSRLEGATGGYYKKRNLKTPSTVAQSNDLATALWTQSEVYLTQIPGIDSTYDDL